MSGRRKIQLHTNAVLACEGAQNEDSIFNLAANGSYRGNSDTYLEPACLNMVLIMCVRVGYRERSLALAHLHLEPPYRALAIWSECLDMHGRAMGIAS